VTDASVGSNNWHPILRTINTEEEAGASMYRDPNIYQALPSVAPYSSNLVCGYGMRIRHENRSSYNDLCELSQDGVRSKGSTPPCKR